MAPRPVEHLARRTLPRALARSSHITIPARLGAARRRRAGRPAHLELYFAFDDPCSAVAALDLAARMEGRRVQLLAMPVVRRGIPDDPAVELKRRYAIVDARRLARAQGLELARSEPLPADSTAFLAEWAADGAERAADGAERAGLMAFCCEALRELWFDSSGPVTRAPFERLWSERLGASRPPDGPQASARVRACQARMARRGIYETPAAWIGGRWFFAHDRPGQICEWLDELGWGEER